MDGLMSVAAAICGCSVICALVQNFISDGGTKKLLSMVMGAFMVCSMLAPLGRAIAGLKPDLSKYYSVQELSASADELYDKQALSLAKQNLEQAAIDILAQNGIKANRAEIIFADSGNNSIIISSLCIYINKENAAHTDRITALIENSFAVVPGVITE